MRFTINTRRQLRRQHEIILHTNRSSKILNINHSSIYKFAKDGTYPPFRKRGKRFIYTLVDLEKIAGREQFKDMGRASVRFDQ